MRQLIDHILEVGNPRKDKTVQNDADEGVENDGNGEDENAAGAEGQEPEQQQQEERFEPRNDRRYLVHLGTHQTKESSFFNFLMLVYACLKCACVCALVCACACACVCVCVYACARVCVCLFFIR